MENDIFPYEVEDKWCIEVKDKPKKRGRKKKATDEVVSVDMVELQEQRKEEILKKANMQC